VLRLRGGDAFIAFDPATGRQADAVTVRADDDSITVRFSALREAPATELRQITWIQGLAKGDKCDAVVRDETEIGVARVFMAPTVIT
jgi:16S rRNA (uracil1498-N3)-methyltransferase